MVHYYVFQHVINIKVPLNTKNNYNVLKTVVFILIDLLLK